MSAPAFTDPVPQPPRKPAEAAELARIWARGQQDAARSDVNGLDGGPAPAREARAAARLAKSGAGKTSAA